VCATLAFLQVRRICLHNSPKPASYYRKGRFFLWSSAYDVGLLRGSISVDQITVDGLQHRVSPLQSVPLARMHAALQNGE
jgi:hypothetical protein